MGLPKDGRLIEAACRPTRCTSRDYARSPKARALGAAEANVRLKLMLCLRMHKCWRDAGEASMQ
jgi:hypothetical protein